MKLPQKKWEGFGSEGRERYEGLRERSETDLGAYGEFEFALDGVVLGGMAIFLERRGADGSR